MEGVSQGPRVGGPEEERQIATSPAGAGWTHLIHCPAEAPPSHVPEPGKGHFLGCCVSEMACPSFKPDVHLEGYSFSPCQATAHQRSNQWFVTHGCVLSRVQLFATPWTVAHQTPLSMGFFRQQYWSGLPCHPPGDLPDPGIEPVSPGAPSLQAYSLPLSHPGSPT